MAGEVIVGPNRHLQVIGFITCKWYVVLTLLSCIVFSITECKPEAIG